MNTKGLREWWETWDIQVVVTTSLLLQVFLVLFAPLRKRMSKWYVTMPLWLSYLLADAAAIYAVGLISKSQVQTQRPPNADLVVFWAPFLLVHLGGPDTITAFSLEDNELWLRHVLSLVVQSLAVAYTFYLSFDDSKLWIPSVLMFIAGVIKYAERTCCLYLASSHKFRDSLLGEPDPGPNYAKLMDEYSSKIKEVVPVIDPIPDPYKIVNPEDFKSLTDIQLVQRGHLFFEIFKGLIANMIFSFEERRASQNFFRLRRSRDAFKIAEIELNFIYDTLCTKVSVVQGAYGFPLRVISFGFSCASLVLFKLVDKPKDRYNKFDVGLTYTLLGGAIALDTVAFFMVLFSDWTAVALSEPSRDGNFFEKLLNKVKEFLSQLLRIDRERWPKEWAREAPKSSWGCFPFGCMMKIVQRRWSESISQYNLVDHCLRPRSNKVNLVSDLFGLTNMLDSIQYVVTKDLTTDLSGIMFTQLKMKSDIAYDLDDTRDMFSARGGWILRYGRCTGLLHWIESVEYDESILLWHIATELLYNTDNDDVKASSSSSSSSYTEEEFKLFSKTLSDYMLYLLIMQNTTMMSTVAGIGHIRYRDTCAETINFFRERNIGKVDDGGCFSNLFRCFSSSGSDLESGKEEKDSGEAKQAKVLKPSSLKGHESKSLLFDGSMLAKELIKAGEEVKEAYREAAELVKEANTEADLMIEMKEKMKIVGGKWEIISRVWIEIMGYAAIRCGARVHAAQLPKGGQLITLVWLLMHHLGLATPYIQEKREYPPHSIITS